MKYLRNILQITLPVMVLAAGIFVSIKIINSKPTPRVEPPTNQGPLVRTLIAQPNDEQLSVTARGSVEAIRTVDLAAEVGGRIVKTHNALRAGGSFTPNDVLIEIDATDYELMITQQEAAVARAELRLITEQAEGEAALRAWEQMEGNRPAGPLVRREPQIRDAKLSVAAAKAQLKRAQTDLMRTKIQLPFSGRVRSVHADIGQTVQRGQRLAVVLDTTDLEVRLPVPIKETAFIDLPLKSRTDEGPTVVMTADFAGARRTWTGSIVRVEGELDRRTRQLTAIARVSRNPDATPLLVGMFVEARILGREAKGVYTIPNSALHSGNHIWIVEQSSDETKETPQGTRQQVIFRLRDRAVEVLRIERNRVILSSGIEPGERVCLSNLQAPIEGMIVRVQEPKRVDEEDR
jgi:membrane fusion protein, multidrug efflux system